MLFRSEGYPSITPFTGEVGYTHAGGIDTPLEIIKGSEVVLPIADWRGQYATGTCPGTKCDPNSYYFPGAQGSTFEEPVPLPNGPPRWIGELVTGMADGSGYQYKRNRYYSPSSGRFTQEDPIGLAGGLNAYGFASGDPVNYGDPFGLEGCEKTDKICQIAVAIGKRLEQPERALNFYAGALASILTAGAAVEAVGGAAAGRIAFGALARAGGNAPLVAAAGAATTLKGAIPDVVPANLAQQIALSLARSPGAATRIMGSMGDASRLVANFGPGEYVKMQAVIRGLNGNITVHFFRNMSTFQDFEFKFAFISAPYR